MFIIVFLLIVSSIPRVLLKPTIAESEYDDIMVDDDETRSKRQTEFFDLLHLAIEKYANCANEHLAPLRALANYKQYETYVYPEEYSRHQTQPVVGAAANNQNKPNLKCTKVNLCSIQKPHAHIDSKPTLVAKSHKPKTENSLESQRRYNPANKNNYARLPIYGSNRFGLRNMPSIYNPGHSQVTAKNNFTSSPLNRSIFSKLLYGPSLENRKKIVIIPTENKTPETILGNKHTNTASTSTIKSCSCSSKGTTDNTISTENKKEIEKTSTAKRTEKDSVLSTQLNNSTISVKPKSCSCLKGTTPKPANINSSKTDPPLGSTYNKDNKAYSSETHKSTSPKGFTDKPAILGTNDPQLNQNLNLLFLQLDIMAHNESKEDLKEILKKLSALKSALKITEHTTEKMESASEAYSSTTVTPTTTISSTTLTSTITASPISSTTSTTTTTTIAKVQELPQVAAKEPVIVATTTKAQELPLVGTKGPEIVTTKAKEQDLRPDAKKDPEIIDNKSPVEAKIGESNTAQALSDTINLQLHKSTQIKNANMDQSLTENSYIHPTKSITNTTTILHSIHTSNQSGNNSSQLLTAIKDLSTKLNLDQIEHITAVTSSPPLDLNIKSSKDLSRVTNEMNTLVSSMANRSIGGNSQQHLNKSQDGKTVDIMITSKTITSKNNNTLTTNKANITRQTSKDHLKNLNLLVTNLNDSLVPHPLQLNNNGSLINSTITISISSNGSFKKIQVEQQSPSDKNLEINEKENMNLGSAKVRSIDMKGTDSRYINVLKTPQQNDPYAEPILSEIYPVKRKFKTKPPLSIYWHKIEEKPLKLKDISGNIWKAFQSDDYDDIEDSDSGNEESLPTYLKECDDYDDISESEESQGEEDNQKPRSADKCKQLKYFT